MLGWGWAKYRLPRELDDMPKILLSGLMMTILLGACTPTIQVAPPDKPIEINMNIKIEHEIRVKVDRDLDEIFDEDSDLF